MQVPELSSNLTTEQFGKLEIPPPPCRTRAFTCLHDDIMARIVGFSERLSHFSSCWHKKCHEVSQNTHRRNGSRVWHRFRPPGFRHSDLFRFVFRHLAGGHYFDFFVSAKTGRKAGEFIGVPAEFVADEFAQILTGFQPLMFRQRRLVMRGISKHLRKKKCNATGNFLIRNIFENNTCEICLVFISWFTFLMLFIDMSDSKRSDTTRNLHFSQCLWLSTTLRFVCAFFLSDTSWPALSYPVLNSPVSIVRAEGVDTALQ